jgi:hypothetical protein
LGKMGGGGVTGYFEIWWKKGSGNGATVSTGALLAERGRGTFTGDLESVLRRVLETGISLQWGPFGKPGRGLI